MSRCTAFCTTGKEKPMMNDAGSTTISSRKTITAVSPGRPLMTSRSTKLDGSRPAPIAQ